MKNYLTHHPGFESSLPGLQFLGAPAARSLGPVSRFVSATPYAARALARRIARKARYRLEPVLMRPTTDSEVVSGGLFTLCDGIVQYHLGGTRNTALKLSPMVLIFETVRQWANENGAHTFHLGGGVGARVRFVIAVQSAFLTATAQLRHLALDRRSGGIS